MFLIFGKFSKITFTNKSLYYNVTSLAMLLEASVTLPVSATSPFNDEYVVVNSGVYAVTLFIYHSY